MFNRHVILLFMAHHFINQKLKVGSILILSTILIAGCTQTNFSKFERLSEEQKRLPENAVLGLETTTGLNIQLMAAEPMLINPTNIDIDDRGRVWVTEAYNYRPDINGNPTTDQGDRIVILEDEDGDGVLDTHTVFYQGPEINAPLGICVLGNRVIVSQSPYVWDFYDDDGDGKADRKEILFQGIGGEQHDHAVHAFVFGPDGKLYFNFGNSGQTLLDKNGQVVLDQDGDPIDANKYREGMVFRCELDGSHVEVLAHNFRNNYELAVDSYGTIWQSDNDDDGNRAVRINYVMEYGNYGYVDEMTGAGWRTTRTNMEDSIPLQHWHLNDPGVVPNLLQTGAGSPTGILVYEGKLLPELFRNQLIHADAGPNIVRSYPVTKDGAGYRADIVDVVKGNDQWFRPSDICIAPDGSLIVADWYDPGVGGHQAGDQDRGRIYRIAPAVSSYNVPILDYTTVEGALAALQNPNISVRYNAWISLHRFGNDAIQSLERLFRTHDDQRIRARALWVLANIANDDNHLLEALADDNPDIRITAIRAARQYGDDTLKYVRLLVNDDDPQVRRECAIALRNVDHPEAAKLWATLASQHKGKDRWYLEALGIGAYRLWDAGFEVFLHEHSGLLQQEVGSDIVWRARTEKAIPYLTRLASDTTTDLQSRLRYFRAFDFISGPTKSSALLSMITTGINYDFELNSLVLRALDIRSVMESAVAKEVLYSMVDSLYGTSDYLELVQRYELRNETPRLLEMALANASLAIGSNAARLLFQFNADDVVREALKVNADSVLRVISTVGRKGALDILAQTMLSNTISEPVRIRSASLIGKSQAGEDFVLALLSENKIPENLIPYAVESVKGAWRKAVYLEAQSFLPGSADSQSLEYIALTEDELLNAKGDVAKGKQVFRANCEVCHQVNGEGYDFGPKLSQIGAKLPKTALYDAIVNPSAGISFGYETTLLKMKEGSSLMGIVSSNTESEVVVSFAGGVSQSFKTADIASMETVPESLMPALHKSMSKEALIDLIAYLSSLK